MSAIDDVPENFDLTPGALDSSGMRPLILTGIIRQLLINHYSNRSTREEKELKSILWADGDTTGILIESARRYKVALAGKRPALLVKRNSYRYQNVVLGDFVGADAKKDRIFTQMWVGSHTVFCLAGSVEAAYAELLATETQRYLTGFEKVIIQTLPLFKFKVSEVGALGDLEESAQHVAVPINIDWAYEESYVLEQQARVLGQVMMSLVLDV